jgi:hypothetical protein
LRLCNGANRIILHFGMSQGKAGVTLGQEVAQNTVAYDTGTDRRGLRPRSIITGAAGIGAVRSNQ